MQEDRRKSIERRADNCDQHLQNSTDLAALKTSTATIRWVIQIGLPVAVAVLVGFFSIAANDLQSSIAEIKSDTKAVRETVSANAERYIETATKVEQLRLDVDELKLRVRTFHDGPQEKH